MVKFKNLHRINLKRIIIFLFLLLPAIIIEAQVYSKVKVYLEQKSITDLIKLGVDIEHGIYEKGNTYTSEFSSADIAILKANNIKYEILIEDVVQYFLDENKNPSPTNTLTNASNCTSGTSRLKVPTHWRLGAMGGYFTYNQMLQILDSMALLFPNLITLKKSASNTLLSREGRTVYYVKISDNPNVDEAGEPKVLYSAVHHAREPLSMSQLIMYMYYLLENYNTDAQIKNIVDNSQLYFIPCVNPDGYLYNQSTNATGGGMWRKNRVKNADSTYGVDLNRNYGKFWGFDNLGSSNVTISETYRGTSAFSEPETRIMKEFAEVNNFVFALNYHTYGNHIIYPWDYKNIVTPDSNEFRAFGGYITQESKYRYGTCYETLHYLANGGSDDWFYGEQSNRSKTYAFTPECGSGFWMPSSQITSTCQNLLEQNIKTAQLALNHATLADLSPKSITLVNGFLKYNIQRLGLLNTDTFTVKIIPVSAGLSVNSNTKKYSGMALLQVIPDSFNYTITPALVVNRKIKYVLQVSHGGFVKNDTLEKFFSDSLNNIFSDKGNSLAGWTNSGTENWSVSSSNFISSPTSIHDSPGEDYQNNATYILTNNSAIDLRTSNLAYLEFYAKWDIEKEYDYVQVLASEFGKNTWIPLCGEYTITGGINQDLGNPVYDGAKNYWIKESMDLKDFLGKKIQIRFQLITDNATVRDGFYIDDIVVIRRGIANTTGIENYTIGEIKIQPNPASDFIAISYSQIEGTSFNCTITDITGRKVYTVNSISQIKTIEVSLFPRGVYFLCLEADGKRYFQKFVVE